MDNTDILARAEEIKAALDELLHLGDAPIGEHWAVCIKKSQLRDALALIDAQAAKIRELEGKQTKSGRWIPGTETSPCMPETEVCSECGVRVVYGHNYRFCPACGAKMEPAPEGWVEPGKESDEA